MERIAVISCNSNPDYMFYAPFAERAWNKLGWRVAIMVTESVDVNRITKNNPDTLICVLPHIDGVREETMAQAGRLYAANYLPDSLIMTCDMDLIPLSDYWHPIEDRINVWGHDLTDYTYIPMGYVAMTRDKWMEVMDIKYNTSVEMQRDFKSNGLAYAPDWEQWWNTDWQILTDKLRPYRQHINFVPRGRRPGSPFAHGRIDRGDSMKMIEPPYIDAHCENLNVKHPDKLNKFLDMYEKIVSPLDFEWY